MALAFIPDAGKLATLNAGNIEEKLSDLALYNEYETGATFLGIVCIRDPPRPEVKTAIEECKTAGIRVVMITGDSKETAVAIAKELKIIGEGERGNSFTG